ncbi:hypothetical protein [Winogradskyella schleiferi]|uniref:hypothetical protein n=1 Tax=Winogradskyella schleiferi TaxID=2686078 RepID=UPI001E3ABFD5|nr:hypothetical protein [Winogradskyella schleiferi]
MDSIAQRAREGDLNKLISFRAYGPKFTEFKNGEVRNGREENPCYVSKLKVVGKLFMNIILQ